MQERAAHRIIIPAPTANAPDTRIHIDALEKLLPSAVGAAFPITD
jgi:hypothetical protein